MLRWTPRWQPIRRSILVKPRSSTRLTSNRATSKPPRRSTWTAWLPRRFSDPVRHESRYSVLGLVLIYGAVVFTSGHVFTSYFYFVDPTYGISMLPTMSAFGDWVVISNYYRRGRGVKAGDIISFKHPVNIGESAVKRVLAMEGDFVLMNTPGKSEAMIQVPQGHCWVVGDNMLYSRDSRMFGPLPMALITGKVVAKFNWQGTLLPQVSRLEHGLKPAYIEDDDVD